MEQLVLITMVVVAMYVSVLLALREQTVKMVQLIHIITYSLFFCVPIHIYNFFFSFILYHFWPIHNPFCIQPSLFNFCCCIFLCLFTTEILACATDPCQNGATCFDHNGGSGYVCLCPAGFEGTNCEQGRPT